MTPDELPRTMTHSEYSDAVSKYQRVCPFCGYSALSGGRLPAIVRGTAPSVTWKCLRCNKRWHDQTTYKAGYH